MFSQVAGSQQPETQLSCHSGIGRGRHVEEEESLCLSSDCLQAWLCLWEKIGGPGSLGRLRKSHIKMNSFRFQSFKTRAKSRPGIEPGPSALGAWSLSHRPTKEVLRIQVLNSVPFNKFFKCIMCLLSI